MAIIDARRTWRVNNQLSRASRGPLIRVTHPNGSVTKMYQQDAIDAGLIRVAKAAPAPEDKKAPAPDDKGMSKPGSKAAEPPPDDFTTIPGVGPASARSLVAQGIRTYAELRGADLSTISLSKSVVSAIEAWRAS